MQDTLLFDLPLNGLIFCRLAAGYEGHPDSYRRTKNEEQILYSGFTSLGKETAAVFERVKQEGGVFCLVKVFSCQATSSAQLSNCKKIFLSHFSNLTAEMCCK